MKNIYDKILKILLGLFLLINIILLTRVLGTIYLPGELTTLDKARQAAQSVVEYSEDMAASYGVAENAAVEDVLAKFKYEIEKAENADETASLMIDYGRQTQDIIFREVQNKRINSIFNLINSQQLPEQGKITISKVGSKTEFLDPAGILSKEIKNEIRSISFNQTLEIEIKNHQASLVPTGDIFNQVNYLQTKVASLERKLKLLAQRGGYEPVSGEGVIIKVSDNSDNLEETSIVHDNDIRNIINELKIAGARGIEVGGQRLTINTPVRCVGPTILVNNKPIPVNPVTIKALGDPDVLKSSLDIIGKQLQDFGINIEIDTSKEIWLKGQSNYER
ncbi:MAG: DUF881 domain-containing protein [Halanaerobiales bacterium]